MQLLKSTDVQLQTSRTVRFNSKLSFSTFYWLSKHVFHYWSVFTVSVPDLYFHTWPILTYFLNIPTCIGNITALPHQADILSDGHSYLANAPSKYWSAIRWNSILITAQHRYGRRLWGLLMNFIIISFYLFLPHLHSARWHHPRQSNIYQRFGHRHQCSTTVKPRYLAKLAMPMLRTDFLPCILPH